MSKSMNAPDGWEIKSFSTLAEIKMGQSPDSELINENQRGMAFLQGNADFGDINPAECYWVSEPKKVAKKGDILISVRAPVGDINIANKEYCIGRGLGALTITKIDATYGFYALLEEKHQLDRLSQGSTFLAIGKGDFDTLKIKYPIAKKEQEQIAKILSTLDQAIEASQKLIEKEKNIKKGLMHDLLTNGIDKNGKIRNPETHEYEESELGLIPVEWEVDSIQNILTIQYGKDQKEVEVINGKYPILGTGGLMGFTNHFLYDKPSVLIGRKGTINKPQYMETPFWTVDTLFYSHIKAKHDPKWVFYIFELINWNKYNEASGVPSLSTANINRIKIKKPSLVEQKEIANIITIQDKRIEKEVSNVEKLKKLKKGLMNDLLSGKVRVKI